MKMELSKEIQKIHKEKQLNTFTPSIQVSGSISLYQGELTDEVVKREISRILVSFPSLSRTFSTMLIDSLKRNDFTDGRLIHAVDKLIDTYVYPNPSVADIIGYDKKTEILTYKQLLDKVDKGEEMINYQAIDLDLNKPRYILKEHFNDFNFKKWKI